MLNGEAKERTGLSARVKGGRAGEGRRTERIIVSRFLDDFLCIYREVRVIDFVVQTRTTVTFATAVFLSRASVPGGSSNASERKRYARIEIFVPKTRLDSISRKNHNIGLVRSASIDKHRSFQQDILVRQLWPNIPTVNESPFQILLWISRKLDQWFRLMTVN